MRRRSLLSAIGTGVVAGCSGVPGNSGTETKRDQNTATPTVSPTPGRAVFKLVSTTAPDTVEIGEPYQFSFTVKNTGGVKGEFSTDMIVTLSNGDQTTVTWGPIELAPGETKTLESDEYTINQLATITYEIAAFEKELQIRVVGRKLRFGKVFEIPDGAVFTVDRIGLKDSYEYEYSGSTRTTESETGEQYVFAWITVRNPAGTPVTGPSTGSFDLVVRDRQYEPRRIRKEEGRYIGGRLQSGVTRSGWIVFIVPDEISRQQVQVVWSVQAGDRAIAVYWSD